MALSLSAPMWLGLECSAQEVEDGSNTMAKMREKHVTATCKGSTQNEDRIEGLEGMLQNNDKKKQHSRSYGKEPLTWASSTSWGPDLPLPPPQSSMRGMPERKIVTQA